MDGSMGCTGLDMVSPLMSYVMKLAVDLEYDDTHCKNVTKRCGWSNCDIGGNDRVEGQVRLMICPCLTKYVQ